MTNNIYLNDMNYNKNCYLSINTTGINRHKNKLFLINLIFPGKEEKLVQIFVNENNPKEDLKNFLKQIENYRLINFNGNSFDIPFINEILRKNNFKTLNNENFDIFTFLKKYNFLELKSYKIKDVYESFFNKDFDLLEQKSIIKIYKEFLKNNNSNLKETLLEQGRLSITYRYEIFQELLKLLNNNSINFSVYGIDYKVSPINYKVSKNFIDISMVNLLDEFYELNFMSNYYKITTKDDFLNVRYNLVTGFIDDKTTATCIVYPDKFGIKEKYVNINDDFIPFIIGEVVDISIITKVLIDTLKSIA